METDLKNDGGKIMQKIRRAQESRTFEAATDIHSKYQRTLGDPLRFVSSRKLIHIVLMCWIVLSVVGLPGAGLAIRPGDGQTTTQQAPVAGDVFPTVPGERPERPIASSQDTAPRKIMEQPRPAMQALPVQRRFADTFLPNSVRYVSDPQDGIMKDGRVAVLEGYNAQVVYQFYNKIISSQGEPDLTIYTHDKGGFDGPYNVFVANFGESTWLQLGMDVMGTASFDFPPTLASAELVLIINRHAGATYIEAIEGLVAAGGLPQGQAGFSYYPEELIGLRAQRLDSAEVERARILLTGMRQGYQLAPLGEIEVKWNSPIKNVWKTEEFFIEAEGEYEIYASDSRNMETFIGRRSGTQGIDLPQDMIDAASVRIRNHSTNRPVMIYSVAGRR
jgi:hypothetical protein